MHDERLTAVEGSVVSSSSAAALEDETRELVASLKSMHVELRKYAVAANEAAHTSGVTIYASVDLLFQKMLTVRNLSLNLFVSLCIFILKKVILRQHTLCQHVRRQLKAAAYQPVNRQLLLLFDFIVEICRTTSFVVDGS